MSRRLVPLLLAALLTALAPAGALRAFVFIEGMPAWPDGTVTLELQLGTTPIYSDGTTPNSTAIEALQAWNPSMARVQLGYVNNSSSSRSRTNGKNNVFFDSTVYGTAFGNGVLAVTVSRWSSGAPTESDVVVNNARTWDSYRGYVSSAIDLRRVLIHEFGHVLGLDHPDDRGQWVTAIMNSKISGVDAPQLDDKDAVTARYGRGPGNPETSPSFTVQPRGTTLVEGQSLHLVANAVGSFPIEYQWYENDVPIEGAITYNFNNPSVRLENAGTYFVRASNPFGTTDSNRVTVVVTAAQPPVIQVPPSDGRVVAGESFQFNAHVTGNQPISFQWTKDGEPVPGAVSNYLHFSETTLSSAGTYRLLATNLGGTTTSQPAVLIVDPPPPLVVSVSGGGMVHAGDYVIFNRYETPFPGRTYQWYHDGVAIAGATSPQLVISNLESRHSGDYFLQTTNAVGTFTSVSRFVQVLGPRPDAGRDWAQALNRGDMVYFVFTGNPRIERFLQSEERWLPTRPLSRVPTAWAVESDRTMLVAFDRVIARLDLETGVETDIATIESGPIQAMTVLNGRVAVQTVNPAIPPYTRLGSISLATPGAASWHSQQFGPTKHLLSDASRGFAIVSTEGAPLRVRVFEDGTFSSTAQSTGGWEITSPQAFAALSGARIFTKSGAVVMAEDFTLLGRLGREFDSIAFPDEQTALVLRSAVVTAYDTALAEIGSLRLTGTYQHVAAHGRAFFVFSQPTAAGQPVTARKHSLDELAPFETLERKNAAIVPFAADDVAMDRRGVVLLYSRLHGNLFRWSTREQRFLPSLPLLGRPDSVIYSRGEDRIYLNYPGAKVNIINLGSGDLTERSHPIALESAATMISADRFLIGSTSYRTITLDSTGRQVWSDSAGAVSRYGAWDPVKRRLYALGNPVSASPLDEDGRIGTPVYSPGLHYSLPIGPIRVSDDGSRVLLGSGAVIRAETMVPETVKLPHALFDGAWLGADVYTMRNIPTGTEISRWDGATLELRTSRILSGWSVRLLATDTQRLVAVTTRAGRTHFTLLDADLNIRNHFEDTPDLTKVALTNLSTRAEVGAGDKIIIAGFVVTGSGPKRILVRAVGPGLNRFGVSGTLPDPMLTLIGGGGQIASNDDWFTPDGESLKLAFREVFAFGLAETSADSALVATLPPGSYTAQVSGKGGAQGVALVEAYDLDAEAGERRLINISTRAVVGIGDKVLIPGLVVDGTAPKRLLIRAVGPELGRFGVAGVLADPQLRVVAGDDAVVAANDNWGEDNTEVTAAATSAAKAFRLTAGGRDAALVVTLPPGSYTVVVSGVGDTSGVALVEVYEVP